MLSGDVNEQFEIHEKLRKDIEGLRRRIAELERRVAELEDEK